MALDGNRVDEASRALLSAIDGHGAEFQSFVTLAQILRRAPGAYPDDLVGIIDGYYGEGAYDTVPQPLTEAYLRYKAAVRLASEGRAGQGKFRGL